MDLQYLELALVLLIAATGEVQSPTFPGSLRPLSWVVNCGWVRCERFVSSDSHIVAS